MVELLLLMEVLVERVELVVLKVNVNVGKVNCLLSRRVVVVVNSVVSLL